MALFKKESVTTSNNRGSKVITLMPASRSDTEFRFYNAPVVAKPQISIDSKVRAEKRVSSTNTFTTKNIDFSKNFKNWCVSPVLNDIYESDIKIPQIHLKEYRLLSSTLFEQMKYFAAIFQNNNANVADYIKRATGDDNNWISKIFAGLQGAVDGAVGIGAGVLEGMGIDTPDMSAANDTDPYEGLYNRTQTGFNYILPLYTNNLKNRNSSYSDSYSGDGKGAIPTAIHDAVNKWSIERATGIRSLVEPGIYTEKTNFYNFGQNLESISFSFPLLNTISAEQINENYQFLFLLLYQNSMFRSDRGSFTPPCIYEVLVPGIRYMKYAHVRELQVDFLGTRRMIEVDSGLGTFKTIVPEAYNVTINLHGLHEESGNFLIRSATSDLYSDDIKPIDITR